MLEEKKGRNVKDLNFYLKKIQKRRLNQSQKESRRKEVFKITAEITNLRKKQSRKK